MDQGSRSNPTSVGEVALNGGANVAFLQTRISSAWASDLDIRRYFPLFPCEKCIAPVVPVTHSAMMSVGEATQVGQHQQQEFVRTNAIGKNTR
jgi:hypothetical protein